jgi:hypothetical protein
VLQLSLTSYLDVQKQGGSSKNPKNYSAIAHISIVTDPSLLQSMIIFSLVYFILFLFLEKQTCYVSTDSVHVKFDGYKTKCAFFIDALDTWHSNSAGKISQTRIMFQINSRKKIHK